MFYLCINCYCEYYTSLEWTKFVSCKLRLSVVHTSSCWHGRRFLIIKRASNLYSTCAAHLHNIRLETNTSRLAFAALALLKRIACYTQPTLHSLSSLKQEFITTHTHTLMVVAIFDVIAFGSCWMWLENSTGLYNAGVILTLYSAGYEI